MLDRRQNARDKVIYGGVAEIGEARRDPGLRGPQYLGKRRQPRIRQRRQAAQRADVADHRAKRPFLPRQDHLVARQFCRRCVQPGATELPVSDLAERLRKSEQKKRQLQRRIKELIGED